MVRTTDFLDEDTVKVTSQHYCLMSFVSPDHVEGQPKGTGKVAVKVRGAFDNIEQAQHHAKKVHRADSSVHTYVVDMYRWILCPPGEDEVENSVYGEEFLQNLFKGYRNSRQVAKAAFAKRTEDVKKDGVDKHLLPEEVVEKGDINVEDLRVGKVMPDVNLDVEEE